MEGVTADNLNIGGSINMTTSHFSYPSFQQEPPVQEMKKLEDIIKYIESDDKECRKKNLLLEC